MTAADLTPLRDAIRYARATGWDHATYGYGWTDHVWLLGDRRVEWYDGTLRIQRPGTGACMWRPMDLAEAVAVLEVAGLLPPVWSRS